MATVAPWQAADYFINQYGRVPTAAEITATQATMQQVSQAYEQNLGRAPDPAGLNYYTTQIVTGKADAGRVGDILADSPEARANAGIAAIPSTSAPASASAPTIVRPTPAQISNLYQATLGRAPDQKGLDFYTAGEGSTRGLTQIEAELRNSPEAIAYRESFVRPGQKTEADRIAAEAAVKNAFNAVLGRDPDANSSNFYVIEILEGRMPQGSIASNIAYGAQGSDQQKADAWATANLGAPIFNKPTTPTTPTTELNFNSVPALYKAIYGRDPDPEGLSFYQEQFGPTIEPEEIDRFISGAKGQDLPTAQTALDYFNRTGDEAGMRRILDASVGNTPLTRDILQLYRPELVNPFQQLVPVKPPVQEQARPIPVETPTGGDVGLIPGSIVPRTGTDIQRVLASYSPESMEAKFATGYQQVFGRDIDPAGAQYWLSRFGNQDLSQAEVNRYLLGGASGEDKAASKPYEMSLTGGRPAPGDPQFFQPIYSPEYRNYAPQQRAGLPVAEPNLLGPGFNPFDYTNKAPTPLTYTGFDPTSIQYQSNLANLAQYAQPVVVPTDEGIAALPTSTP